MNPIEQYIHDRDEQVRENLKNGFLEYDVFHFTGSLVRTNYTKNFTWMGVPILQYPTDLMVMQELISEIKPDCIIETGTAFGGMTRFYRDMQGACCIEPAVFTIDVEFRRHTLEVLEEDVVENLIFLVEGDSSDDETLGKLIRRISDIMHTEYSCLVSLDSNHTHDHVLKELRLYSPMVSVGSYIVVFDTAIEQYGHLDKNQDRPWGPGNNPATAVKEFMEGNDEFVVDKEVEQRALITAAPGGWLRRVK